MRSLIVAIPLLLASSYAWADTITQVSPLPAPAVFSLVAAGVIGAVLVARRRK